MTIDTSARTIKLRIKYTQCVKSNEWDESIKCSNDFLFKQHNIISSSTSLIAENKKNKTS